MKKMMMERRSCYLRKLFPIVFLILAVLPVMIITKDNNDISSSNSECYQVEILIDGLYNPLAVEFLMDKQQQQMLIAEHWGVIRLYDFNIRSMETFLNLTDRVYTTTEPMDERGLLGLAIDPNFEKNNYFYVFYSTQSQTPSLYNHDSVISRFQAMRINGNQWKGIKASELEILRIKQPGSRQNGGQIFFANDGYLYITTGDGGDRENSRFKKDSLLGKILRVDVSKSQVNQKYTIPDDNPFVNDPDASAEVYAYGFRNPWRCTVDYPKEKSNVSTIFCGDLGEPKRNVEDLNVVHKGGRYGWLDDPNAQCHTVEECQRGLTREGDYLPIHTYARGEGQAIIGGIVYRGQKFPKLINKYIYGDYVHGSFHILIKDNGKWKVNDLCVTYPNNNVRHHILGIAKMGQDDIIIMTNTKMANNEPTGVIYKFKANINRNLSPKLPAISTILLTMTIACAIFI